MSAGPAKGSERAALILALGVLGAVPAQAADSALCARIAPGAGEGVVGDAPERTAFRRVPVREGEEATLRRLKQLLRDSLLQGRPGRLEWSGAQASRVDCDGRAFALLTVAVDDVHVLPAAPASRVPASAPAAVVERYRQLRETRALTLAELEELRLASLKLGRLDEAARVAQEIFRCRSGWGGCD